MARDKRDGGEHFTTMIRPTMEEPAWRALSTTAQALYPWLKLEWRGPRANNNGKIRLSTRLAAERLGNTSPSTVSRAFQELQAKGFIVMTEHARLGVEGAACSPAFELTELKMPASERPDGRKLYRDWRPGRDFPVHRANANNPHGRNAHKQASGKVVRLRPKK